MKQHLTYENKIIVLHNLMNNVCLMHECFKTLNQLCRKMKNNTKKVAQYNNNNLS